MTSRLSRNAIWALAEVVVSSVTLFLLYRIVTATLGVRALGIWSLVLATTSLARFGDLGASAGLSRLVAVADEREGRRPVDYVEAALLTTAALYGAMALVLFWPVKAALQHSLAGPDFESARALLPYSLVSFAIAATAGSVTTGLIGQHRADHKSMLAILAFFLQLTIAVISVKAHGLVGLAWAQIAQNVFLLIAGWLLFLRNDAGRLVLAPPFRWRKKVVSELLGFGMQLQAANLISFLFEPMTKFVMSSLGGLEALGLYEMANRMILQVRQLIVAPVQVLTPAFAVGEREAGRLERLYERAFATALPLASAATLTLVAASPLVSIMWVGHLSGLFVSYTAIMGVGWLVNMIASPAYLVGVGRGRVGWNIAGHVITSGGGPLLSLLFGGIFGAVGVAVGASTMLALGALVGLFMNCRKAGFRAISPAGVVWEIHRNNLRRLRAALSL